MQININFGLDEETDLTDLAQWLIASKFRHGAYFNGVRVAMPTTATSAKLQKDYYSIHMSVFLQALLEN